MKAEQWEYITTNWGTSDPVIMEQIAQIKADDEAELKKLQVAVEERDKTIQDLTKQNVDINRTNMDLMLRLTDPKNAPAPDDEDDIDDIPDLDDFDAFVED